MNRTTRRSLALLTLLALLAPTLASPVAADAPRVLPEGTLPDDRRLEPLKDLDGYFPFDAPATREEWDARARKLRRQVLVATGLWPIPEKTPLEPVIHGRVERDGFTVEKVFFESVPGHFVTGLLFRPESATGRRPGVLCPHGHGGRLYDLGEKGILRQIVSGAERFRGSGRFPKLARCAQLARMGCVAFIFDMLGYADSVQLSHDLAHRFAKQRPELDSKERWGFYSTQAELRLQSVMGVQTWNAVRALDFLAGLPDVDPDRLAVTGGSGGGTQTILLGAIDPRPAVAFPQGMVSTSMQGGCTCENCSLLRIGTGNVELAALFAPKPLGMTAADDWTREMMTKGFPDLKRLYELLGAPENVLCRPLLHFPHNYNYVTRAIMYSWLNRHLGLGLEEPVVEEDWRPLTPEEHTVWDEAHPRPEGGVEYEVSLTRYLDETSRRQLAALAPRDAASLERWSEVVGGAFEAILGRTIAEVGPVERETRAERDHDGLLERLELWRAARWGEALPVVSLRAKGTPPTGRVVIWVDGAGKAGLFESSGQPRPAVRRLLAAGAVVVGADLFLQGEFLAAGETAASNRVVSNPREFAGYTYCYNHPLLAQRVHDVLTLVAGVRSGEGVRSIDLVGAAGAGPWVAAAGFLAGATVDRVAIDTGGFRFADLDSYRDADFLPGAVKYGDLPALLALLAPASLWIAGEGRAAPEIVAAAYAAAGSAGRVTSADGGETVADAIASWLLGGGPVRGRTTLAEPAVVFEPLERPAVEVAWGGLTATLVTNEAVPPSHRAGYNGLLEIRAGDAPSPFVPAYAGLNLEHVNNGAIYPDRDLQFEPRRHPMELRSVDERTYELYQAPLPNTGLESSTRFTFSEPGAVDVVFECVPRLEKFPHGHLNLFWASYILEPDDPAIHFLGRKKGEDGERWIRAVSPEHGVSATHRSARDHREFAHDNPFPLTLVFNESEYEYTRPFYYGRYGDHVWIVMFRGEDLVRFTQSPSGGGQGNPAWDFQWFIERPRVGELYRLVWRAVYKRWAGREDVLAEHEKWGHS